MEMKAPKMRSSVIVLSIRFLGLTGCATGKETVVGNIYANPGRARRIVVKRYMTLKLMGSSVAIRVLVAPVAPELLFCLSAEMELRNQNFRLGC